MESKLMQECETEKFYQYLIPPNVLGGLERQQKEDNHCVVFCKKVSENVFNIRKGIAVVNGVKTCFNDGICMIAPDTKVVFVFENN